MSSFLLLLADGRLTNEPLRPELHLNEVKKTLELSTENVRFILDTLLERYFRDTK